MPNNAQMKDLLLFPFRVLRFICFWIGFLLVTGLAAVSLYGFWLVQSLPEVDAMKFEDLKKTAIVRVQSIRAKKLAHRVPDIRWVPLGQVSRELKYSIVMSEDANFFRHHGFDYSALWDAFLKNLDRKQYVRGASTISQQVIKNTFLTKEKTINRKLREVYLTRQLESKFDKNQILEVYLNIAEWGPNIYGINEACQYYFHKPASQINAAEGVWMASLLPSPVKGHWRMFAKKELPPYKRKVIMRVLKDMQGSGVISHDKYMAYINYDYFGLRAKAQIEEEQSDQELQDDLSADEEDSDADLPEE